MEIYKLLLVCFYWQICQNHSKRKVAIPKSFISCRKPGAVSIEQRGRAKQMMIGRNQGKEVLEKINGIVRVLMVEYCR